MLTPDNTLLLVVDIQERLLPVLHQNTEFTAASRRMIEGANILDVAIAITEQYPKGLGATLPEIITLIPDAPIFAKIRFSAWIDDIHAIVRTRQPENIILIGCETHICVLQTALDMRDAGLNVYVPQECVTSRAIENKINGLEQMRAAGAIISNIESLLFMLMQDAKHPHFKEISQLIQ
ncbi:isochorismatase family protein [Wielerella bovis]|uniref:isochorismatase family protein n=1 Tax=Wielerella bovis TaxID=2917790 RepID=UPI002019B282|nr:isochorismatase family protein [Wielerella bovis]ULJ70224.1 isochorismatase family protein [Wielerella bovis]